MTKIEPRLLKGFRDYGLSEQAVRQDMFRKIQTVFERFGFLPLSTPVLEFKEILMGKYGEDERLIYSFKDNGERDVAMRYDLTVPLARYVAQNQGQLVLPFKRYQIAPVWRAENTQKGRLREFYQCDADVVGTDSVLADAEIIACMCQAIEALGVKNYVVKVNDRKIFADLSRDAIRAIDKLDKIGVDGITVEMKEKGLPQDEIDKVLALVQEGGEPPASIQELIRLVKEFGVQGDVSFAVTIARGLDYYTGTVFEISLKDKPEYGSVCGGGRYDGLVDTFSDQSLSAVGASIGIDRLLGAMEEMGLTSGVSPVKVLVLNLDEARTAEYAKLASELRSANINTELYYSPAKLDKQFKYAEAKKIPYAVICGEAERVSGKVQLKDLSARSQEELTVEEVIAKLK